VHLLGASTAGIKGPGGVNTEYGTLRCRFRPEQAMRLREAALQVGVPPASASVAVSPPAEVCGGLCVAGCLELGDGLWA